MVRTVEDTLRVQLKKIDSKKVEYEIKSGNFLLVYKPSEPLIFGDVIGIDRGFKEIELVHIDVRKSFFWKDVEEAWLLVKPKNKQEMNEIESFLTSTIDQGIPRDALETTVKKLLNNIEIPLIKLNKKAKINTKHRAVWTK